MSERLHFGTDGRYNTPEYRSWNAMRHRCLFPSNIGYANYGGRGIKVCDEWEASFAAFLRDMGTRPRGTTLDRLDNDGPYCKDNCRWSTPKEQRDNQRAYKPRRQQLMSKLPTSGYRGVEEHFKAPSVRKGWARNGRWAATFRGKRIGFFKTAENAATAWNFIIHASYGESATFNGPKFTDRDRWDYQEVS